MKKFSEIFVILVFSFLSVTQSHSETPSSKTMELQFSDLSKPGILKIINGNGDITITGYDGKNVLVNFESRGKIVEPPEENEKAKGMKRITGTRFNINEVKEENAIVISRAMKDETDLIISVPRNTSLRIGSRASGEKGEETAFVTGSIMDVVMGSIATALNFSGGMFQGNITVENVIGDMEISTLEGAITVRDASGSIVASAMDGDVTVTFTSVKNNNPMAFSTMDGDIDVTFPANIKAMITAKNVDGDIFTDFDMEMVPVVQVTKVSNTGEMPSKNLLQNIEQKEKTGPKPSSPSGIYVGMFGNTVSGKINGGGMEIQMTTIDGNIYIRKAK